MNAHYYALNVDLLGNVEYGTVMNFEDMSEKAVLEELGRRVQTQRLNVNLAQAEVASKAGVSRRALQNLESGRGCTLSLLIRVLRALGKLGQLDAFLPEPGLSPIQLAKLKGRERRRAFVPRSRLKEKET